MPLSATQIVYMKMFVRVLALYNIYIIRACICVYIAFVALNTDLVWPITTLTERHQSSHNKRITWRGTDIDDSQS